MKSYWIIQLLVSDSLSMTPDKSMKLDREPTEDDIMEFIHSPKLQQWKGRKIRVMTFKMYEYE